MRLGRLQHVLATVALAACGPMCAQQPSPNVTLTGQLQGANGLPAANQVVTFQPTQTMYIVGSGQPGGCAGGTLFEHNGTPLANQCLLNFNDTTPAPPSGYTNVIWQTDANGNLSAYVHTGGSGSGCDTISNGGDCVSNDPTVDQIIAQPSGTEFGVQFPSVGGQPNSLTLNSFDSQEDFNAQFNNVTLYSNTHPMDIESANGGLIGSYTHSLGDAQWATFQWDANGNTFDGAGMPDTVGPAGNQPYPGWSVQAPGTLQIPSANGVVIESNSLGQSGEANVAAVTGGVQYPVAGTAQPIVTQGTLGFAQSVLATYNSGWTQTVDTTGKEAVSTTINGFASTNTTCGPAPCTWVQIGFATPQPADEIPPFWSDCNLSTGCTGLLPGPSPPSGYLQSNYQAPFLLLTISGSTCASGAANGTWTAYHTSQTFTNQYGVYNFVIPNVALSNTSCVNDHPVITFMPVLGGYGEQVQFIDGSAGPVTAKLIPANAPLNSGLTSSSNAARLPTAYTSSLQVWVGRADSDSANGVTILPWAGDTINGLSSYTLPTAQYSVVHFLSDGKHNWYVESGSGTGVASLNTLTGALTIAATSPITVTPSGGNTLTIACPTCGTSTGATVTINGGTALGTANFNGTTPAAGANGLNVTWQQSGSSVSAEIVGDGNPAHYLSGAGTWTAPSGGGGDTITSPGSTLSVGGTPTNTTLDINLAHANTWTAAQTITTSGSGTTGPFYLNNTNNTASSSIPTAIYLCPNLASTSVCYQNLGVANTQGNSAGLNFKYLGANNAGNAVFISFFGNSAIQSWFNSGDVSIGSNVVDPGKLLGVGSSNQFTVDSSGNVITSGTFTLSAITGTKCLTSTSGLVGGGACPQTIAATSHQWLNSFTASTGAFTATQPAFSDLSGQATLAQLPNGTANSVLLGYGATGSGAPPVQITLGTNLSMSGTTLNATGGGATSWNAITNPTGNLSLTMGANTTLFTFNATTGASDLFALTDTLNNTGTGILMHPHTASGSTEIPWQADANGCGWQITPTGTLASVGCSGTTHGVVMPEGSPIAGSTGNDVLTTNSTNHRFQMNLNNAGALNLVGIATAGTSGHLAVLATNGIDITDGGAVPTGTVTGVTGTAPIASSGGTTPAISINTNGITATQLAAQYSKGSCTEVWGGSGTSFALTSGDDAISNNTCYNDSGVTRTITAVKCRVDVASNTTTVNPTFGSAGTGTTILSGALTCGSSLAYSSSGTVSSASWTTGTGINPVMGGTLTGTSVAMIVEYTY